MAKGAKVGELSQNICPKQPQVQTLPEESVRSVTPSFLQYAWIFKGMEKYCGPPCES